MHKKRELESDTIKQENSVTRSPPMKKSQEKQSYRLIIENTALETKDEEIMSLKNMINQLRH